MESIWSLTSLWHLEGREWVKAIFASYMGGHGKEVVFDQRSICMEIWGGGGGGGGGGGLRKSVLNEKRHGLTKFMVVTKFMVRG